MRKNRLSITLFLLGLFIFFYPYISRAINNINASKIVYNYSQQVTDISKEEKELILNELDSYNEGIGSKEYLDLSDINSVNMKDDIFAAITIPKLKLELPIYLGTSEKNLSKGVSQIIGTSLPLGGGNTHCVLAAHSGYINNEWFSNIRKLQVGDIFYVTNINEDIFYRIYDKKTIEPYDTSNLKIVKDKDLLTLLTCDRPGIKNNKRIIVMGERIKDKDEINEYLNKLSKGKVVLEKDLLKEKEFIKKASIEKMFTFIFIGLMILLFLKVLF